MAKIIAVANQKGGVGKTTTTVNLSAALSLMGKRVLLVDCDPQGNASSGMGVSKSSRPNTYDLLINAVPAEDCVVHTDYGDVIPASKELAAASVELIEAERREYVLKDALNRLYSEYDYMFIDCPPSLGIVMTSSLVACDSVLIPIQAEFLAMDGLALINSSIERIRSGVNPSLELNGIVFTMVNAVAKLTQDVMEEVRGHFGDKVYETTIPRNVRVSEAPSMGVPVVFLDPRSKGAEAYKAFAWEFMAKNPTRYSAMPEPPPAPATPAPVENAPAV